MGARGSPVLTSLSGYNEESWPLRLSKDVGAAKGEMAGDEEGQRSDERSTSCSTSWNFLLGLFPSFDLTLSPLDCLHLSGHFVSLLQLRPLDSTDDSITCLIVASRNCPIICFAVTLHRLETVRPQLPTVALRFRACVSFLLNDGRAGMFDLVFLLALSSCRCFGVLEKWRSRGRNYARVATNFFLGNKNMPSGDGPELLLTWLVM